MRAIYCTVALVLTVAAAATPVNAKGCIKGAVIGGVAGHYAGHHGVLGAVAGCIIGRHEAHKRQKTTQNPSSNQPH